MNRDDISDWLYHPVTVRFFERCGSAMNKSLVDMHGCVVNANANAAALQAGRVLALQYILDPENMKSDLPDEAEESEDG